MCFLFKIPWAPPAMTHCPRPPPGTSSLHGSPSPSHPHPLLSTPISQTDAALFQWPTKLVQMNYTLVNLIPHYPPPGLTTAFNKGINERPFPQGGAFDTAPFDVCWLKSGLWMIWFQISGRVYFRGARGCFRPLLGLICPPPLAIDFPYV